MDRLRSGHSTTFYFRAVGLAMTRKFLWVVAAVVLALVCFDKTRSMLERRRRADDKEELVRWEGEGGNVPNA